MSRRFQKIHRSIIRKSLKRRKRQQDLDAIRADEAMTPRRESSLWDSEEGLFAGDTVLVPGLSDQFSFA
jgi:hypothetical protein